MPSHQLLSKWIVELQAARAGLAYEITKVFGDDERSELDDAITEGLKNVDRVLGLFRKLPQHARDDAEEFWYDFLPLLDCISYYACLALPLVRQILESENRLLSSNQTINASFLEGIDSRSEAVALPRGLSGQQREYAERACQLAHECDAMYHVYEKLQTAEQFLQWSKHFLKLSAGIVQLAAEVSLFQGQSS
jgi:hypothetical protein